MPDAVLDLLGRFATTVPGTSCTTIAYVVIDATTSQIAYACAGHPYPLVVESDGTAGFLRDGRRPPLRTASLEGLGPEGHEVLPPGALIILYTDGLIERRGESLHDGLERLRAAAAERSRLPVGALCDELVAQLMPDGGYSDDVAIVALRLTESVPDTHVEVIRARASDLAGVRHRLRTWLERTGHVAPTHDILGAVGEALNNAIEHGSELDPSRTVAIEAFRLDNCVSITVSDSGRWSKDSATSSREGERGRGLTLIHGLSTHARIVRTVSGTRVTMTFACDPPT
jgi:anti-sigma regulatory factor (Ser/Thr protein kinase)